QWNLSEQSPRAEEGLVVWPEPLPKAWPDPHSDEPSSFAHRVRRPQRPLWQPYSEYRAVSDQGIFWHPSQRLLVRLRDLQPCKVAIRSYRWQRRPIKRKQERELSILSENRGLQSIGREGLFLATSFCNSAKIYGGIMICSFTRRRRSIFHLKSRVSGGTDFTRSKRSWRLSR